MSETTTKTRPGIVAPVMTDAERKELAKMPARAAGGAKVSAFFDANKASLAKLLPAHMTPERFLKVAMNALRTNPKLMDCTVESLFGATMFCAQVGLEPNTPLGHVYLIPFANNKKQRTEVQVIIGYQGFIALARRSGEIASISAQAVYANDDYEIDYLNPEQSRHKPRLNGPRGDFIGAWAKATFKDGGMAFDFMPREDIERIRDGSQGYRTAMRYGNKNTPWITHFDQMAVKTAIRRLAKRLPLSIEMAAAVALDEREDRRASQGMGRAMTEALDGQGFDLSVLAGEVDEDEGAGDDPAPQIPPPTREEPPPHDPETGEVLENPAPRRRRQAPPADDTPPGDGGDDLLSVGG